MYDIKKVIVEQLKMKIFFTDGFAFQTGLCLVLICETIQGGYFEKCAFSPYIESQWSPNHECTLKRMHFEKAWKSRM